MHFGRGRVADVGHGQRVVDEAGWTDRNAGVHGRQPQGRRRRRAVVERPGPAAVRAGRDDTVERVEADLVDADDRDPRAERVPVLAAVVGHERTDVGRRVDGVRRRGVGDQPVDRRVRKVARDVLEGLSAVARLEDVARPGRGRGVEAVVGDVGDAPVAAVDGDAADRSLRQPSVVVAAVVRAVLARVADLDPGRVRAGLCVRADPEQAVVGADVDSRASAGADRGDRAVARAVGRGPGAAAGQVAADERPLDVTGGRLLRVVRPIDAVGAGEQLVGVLLVEHERHVELSPVVHVDAVGDRLVLEEAAAAVGHAVDLRRRREVRAVDETRVVRVDLGVAAVTGRDVVPRAEPGELAQRAVVLRPAHETGGARGVGLDGAELGDLEAVRGVRGVGPRVHVRVAVEVDPVDCVELGLAGCAGNAAALVLAVPDASVGADQDVLGVVRVENDRVEVGVLVPAEVLPVRASVVGAEDAARRRGERVAERARREHHVRVRRVGLDHVVVGALRAAVVGHSVEAADTLDAEPRGAGVGRLEDPRDAMRARATDTG